MPEHDHGILEQVWQYGWPSVALVVVVGAFALVVRTIAKWLAPRFDKLIDGHLSAVAKMTDSMQEHGDTLDGILDAQKKLCDTVEAGNSRMEAKLGEVHDAIKSHP